MVFLYPKGEAPPPADGSIPTLRLPLRVGLGFVPASNGATATALPEALKNELLALLVGLARYRHGRRRAAVR